MPLRPKRKKKVDPERRAAIVDEVRRRREERAQGYREKALALFPHVCGRCGRSFEGANLHELTVHHRDHNHDNNPPDGSNWELLCLYCHDNEHSRHEVAEAYTETAPDDEPTSSSINRPFANLEALLKNKEK